MKKTIVCMVLALALLARPAVPALASGNNSAAFVIGMNQYFVNNQAPGINMDTAAYIDPDTGGTLVPVRYLADALGARTHWDDDTQQITVSTAACTIGMNIGSTTLTVDGQAQTMGAAPVINDGRTYVSAHWMAEAMGYQVDWNTTNKILTIWLNGMPEPDYSIVVGQARQAMLQLQPVTSPNLLTLNQADGGEDGTIDGWNAWSGNNGSGVTYNNDNTIAYQGDYSIRITNTYSSAQYIESEIIINNINPSLTYTFNAWVNPNISSSNINVYLNIDQYNARGYINTQYSTDIIMKNGKWTFITFTFTPVVGTSYIHACVGAENANNNDYFNIDQCMFNVGSQLPWQLPLTY